MPRLAHNGVVGGSSPPRPTSDINGLCCGLALRSIAADALRCPQRRLSISMFIVRRWPPQSGIVSVRNIAARSNGAGWLIHSFNGTDLLGGGGGGVGCPDSSLCPEANPTKTTYSIETSAILIIIRTPCRAGHTV